MQLKTKFSFIKCHGNFFLSLVVYLKGNILTDQDSLYCQLHVFNENGILELVF